MKEKLSVSLEKRTLKNIENALKNGLFRNKSHLIEYSIQKFLEEKNEQK